MSNARGVFISFESVDGLGKSTQIRLLGETLTASGFDVVMKREPGSSNVGPGIRHLLFNEGKLVQNGVEVPAPTTKGMAPGVADSLFLADHIQNAADIEALVAAGKVVLCDRYADSQFAYAASPTKKCPNWALEAYSRCFGLVPDLTVLLIARGDEIPPSVSDSTPTEDIGWALVRAQKRRGVEAGKQDGKAWNSVQEQLKIQEGYLKDLQHQARTIIVDVREEDNIPTVRSRILTGILDRGLLQAKHPSVTKAAKILTLGLLEDVMCTKAA